MTTRLYHNNNNDNNIVLNYSYSDDIDNFAPVTMMFIQSMCLSLIGIIL